MGFTPFAKPNARSNVIIAMNYIDGMDDKKFRGLLSQVFKVLVAGGFGSMKGKVFRIGSMGEVNSYHVLRTLSSIASAMTIMGLKTNSESIAVASENLKSLN